jgi:hypothetical protein
MLRVAYHPRELLVYGRREDYAELAATVRHVLSSDVHEEISVVSTGTQRVDSFVIRRGPPPNRVGFQDGRIVISIAPSLEMQFLSFIQFPEENELPKSPVGYHHHYEDVNDGKYVAPDSLPVVFGLERM